MPARVLFVVPPELDCFSWTNHQTFHRRPHHHHCLPWCHHCLDRPNPTHCCHHPGERWWCFDWEDQKIHLPSEQVPSIVVEEPGMCANERVRSKKKVGLKRKINIGRRPSHLRSVGVVFVALVCSLSFSRTANSFFCVWCVQLGVLCRVVVVAGFVRNLARG